MGKSAIKHGNRLSEISNETWSLFHLTAESDFAIIFPDKVRKLKLLSIQVVLSFKMEIFL